MILNSDLEARRLYFKRRLSRKEVDSDYHCIDCGVDTFPSKTSSELAALLFATNSEVPERWTKECEVYIVNDSIWKQAGMERWGGCLCIGCLERRIGRKLKPRDFPEHPFKYIPGTPRLRERMGVPMLLDDVDSTLLVSDLFSTEELVNNAQVGNYFWSNHQP